MRGRAVSVWKSRLRARARKLRFKEIKVLVGSEFARLQRVEPSAYTLFLVLPPLPRAAIKAWKLRLRARSRLRDRSTLRLQVSAVSAPSGKDLFQHNEAIFNVRAASRSRQLALSP